MKTFQDAAGPFLERWFWPLTAAVLIIGLGFRLPGIDSRSLWIDELFTEWFVSQSFYELWVEMPKYENHTPLFYTALKAWTLLFGNSELGLRSFSLVLSLATIAVVAVAGRHLDAGWKGRAAGLLGALLLAVNYASIREAQNARPYALQGLVCTLAVAAALVLVVRLRRQARQGVTSLDWVMPVLVLGLSSGIGLWIHNTGFFIALGIWAGLTTTLFFAPAEQRLRQLLIFFAAGLLALAAWAPYLPVFLAQSQKFMGLAFWLTPKFRDLYSAWLLVIGDGWLGGSVLLSLLLFGLYRVLRADFAMALVVLIILLLPLNAVLAVSFGIKPIYIQRLFAWMVPLALAIMAFGIVTASRSKWPVAAMALVALGFTVNRTVADYGRPLDDWKAISAEIASNAQPGDVVIAVPAEGSIAVDYYAARHPNFPPVVCIPGCYPQRDLPRTYLSNFGAPQIIQADSAIVDKALATYKRVWLVQVSISLYDPKGIVRKRIASQRDFVRFTGNSLAKVELFQ